MKKMLETLISLDPIEQSTSPELKKVVSTAMSLSPSERYQTARDMIDGLDAARGSVSVQPPAVVPEPSTPVMPRLQSKTAPRRVVLAAAVAVLVIVAVSVALWTQNNRSASSGASGARIASIGVLPFANQSDNKEMEYFTDGLTDELISALSHVRGLQVAGRSSSFAIKGKNLDARQAAERLQVAYVVDAGVRSGGSRIRVTWQLMDGVTGRGLGSGDIDGEMHDVIALQDSMAKKIVDGLRPVIGGGVASDGARKNQTDSFEAHDLYLKGRFYWNQRTAEAMRRGIAYLKQAIEKDPRYALAWAELSTAYSLEPAFGDMPPSEAMQPGRDAAKKAVELDPTLAEAYTASGISLNFSDWDPRAALPYLDKAIALDPQNSFNHLFRVWPLVSLRRMDEALGELRKARELDPLSAIINTRIGSLLIFQKRFDDAEAELRKAIEIDPSNLLARFELGRALAGAGKFDEAFSQFPDAIDGENGFGLTRVAWAHARAGRPERARMILGRLQRRSKERYVSRDALAGAAAAAGDMALALDYLEGALRDHSFYLQILWIDPSYDALRDEPRFRRALREVERKYPGL